jgi:uncharacterized protein YjbI with pentapeptide repeats
MSSSPSGRCGYMWPEDHETDDRPRQQSCCWRETPDEHDQCVWHADTNEIPKSVRTLQSACAPPETREKNSPYTELLDGAKLSGVNLEGRISFENVSLRDSDLSNADLGGTDLSNADLGGTDLSNADLLKADLSNADLLKADLSNADLGGTDLSNADLLKADLSNADLLKADLSNADLLKADLSNADLLKADLSNASLFMADLPNANLRKANLSNANLREADLSSVNLASANLFKINCSDLSIDDVSKVAVNSRTRISSRIPLRSGFRHRPTSVWKSDYWDGRARGYELLRKVFQEKGLDYHHRKLYSFQRKARAKEALRIGLLIQWLGNYFSRILTGHGVMVTRVFFWTALVILVPWYWYGLVEGWTQQSLDGSPLYYSIVTFVTSPPHPLPDVQGSTDHGGPAEVEPSDRPVPDLCRYSPHHPVRLRAW